VLGAPRRFVVQPLVSVHMADGGGRVPWNRAFMERIRAPEVALLRRAEAVYPRDEPTAAGCAARACGRPLPRQPDDGRPQGRSASMPGPTCRRSPCCRAAGPRAPAVASCSTRSPGALDERAELAAAVAWTQGPPPPLPRDGRGGRALGRGPCGAVAACGWRGSSGRFADVLHTADAVLGTTGTAQEQAAGLGLPVVSFPVRPMLAPAFLANQARLLGEALEVVPREPAAIAARCRRALLDPMSGARRAPRRARRGSAARAAPGPSPPTSRRTAAGAGRH
jgi:hypothetical protein